MKPLLALLDNHEIQRGRWIIFLVSLHAVLDFFSLAFFLPVLITIANPEFITSNPLLHKVYTALGFSSRTTFIISLTGAVLSFIIAKNLISVWIVRIKTSYAFGIGGNLAVRALAYYLGMNFLSFSKADFSRELNRITNYPFAFANHIVLPVTTLIGEGLICLLIVAGIALYNHQVFLMLLLLLIPTIFLYAQRKKKLKAISRDHKEKYPRLLKYALQTLEGFAEIKTSQKASYFKGRFQTATNSLTKTFIQDHHIQSLSLRLNEVIVGTTLCSLLVYVVLTQQDLPQTMLLLGVYAGASFRVIPSINRIFHASQQIRIHEHVLEDLSLLTSFPKVVDVPSGAPVAFSESIVLKELGFSYPGGPPVLVNVSLVILKGEKIAVTGNSGEGKTTFILLLLRLLQETQGEIHVDGLPLRSDTGWRQHLGYVPQNPFILDATVAENIAFGIPAAAIDRNKITGLLSDLDLEKTIGHLPQGMDTPIGEHGVKLSGGQRQRLAIARVLYANADVLLLDEITNQVHPFLEQEIFGVLNKLSGAGKTIIMVTHKLTHPDFFDAVYRLEHGNFSAVRQQL